MLLSQFPVSSIPQPWNRCIVRQRREMLKYADAVLRQIIEDTTGLTTEVFWIVRYWSVCNWFVWFEERIRRWCFSSIQFEPVFFRRSFTLHCSRSSDAKTIGEVMDRQWPILRHLRAGVRSDWLFNTLLDSDMASVGFFSVNLFHASLFALLVSVTPPFVISAFGKSALPVSEIQRTTGEKFTTVAGGCLHESTMDYEMTASWHHVSLARLKNDCCFHVFFASSMVSRCANVCMFRTNL